MPLSPEQIAELERRGPSNVRDMLLRTGAARGTTVLLETPGNATRSEVEKWLREQELAADERERRRYRLMLGWTIAAAIFAAIAAFRWW